MKSKSYIGNGRGGVILKELEVPNLSESEVLVRIKCFGLNRVDILQAKGVYLPPPGSTEVLGLEFSGEILELSNKNSRFKIGDRVCGLTSAGAFSEYIVISEKLLSSMAENISFQNGAAIPESWITADFNLNYLNKISKGEVILIHSAAGGVGLSALQIAIAKGAEVIASVGSYEKVNYLEDTFGARTFNYKDSGYEKILKNYEGKLNFILDTVGPSILNFHTSILGSRGRIQNIGLLGGQSGQIDMSEFIKKNLTISSSTLRSQEISVKSYLCKNLEKEILPQIENSTFKTPIYRELSADKIEDGFKLMISNEIIGKIVYNWEI